MPRLDEVIVYLRPGKEWSLVGESILGLTFADESVEPITQMEYDQGKEELIAKETEAKEASAISKAALLSRLGITEDEAKLLLN